MNPVMGNLSAGPATAASVQPARLANAAQEFEGILLSTWLEKLQESFAGQDDGSDPAHGTLASMGTEAIASALAARGGIGIAKMLVQHFGKPAQASASSDLAPQAGNKDISRGLKSLLAAADNTLRSSLGEVPA